MKTKLLFLVTMLAFCFGCVFAQSSNKELNKKASKAARKEAKAYKKEGWMVTPGALPLDKQLDRAYLMQYEIDDNGYPKQIVGEGRSIGGNYDAAKMQAIEIAKQNLAGMIQTEITAIIENTISNQQLEEEEAVSITKTINASKNLISQSIGRTITILEAYRTLNNKNKEVVVRLAYNGAMAKKAALNAVKNELEKRGDELHKQLDKVMGF